MRHKVYGKKLSRGTDERRRLFTGLARELFLNDSLRTTITKAKAVQSMIDRLITRAKSGDDQSRRYVMKVLTDKKTSDSVLAQAKTRFHTRMSGFTRIYKLGPRRGDASEVALLRFVDEYVPPKPLLPKGNDDKKKPKKKDEKPLKAGSRAQKHEK